MNLVVDQVLQPLVESGSDEDTSVQRSTSVSLVQRLVTVALISHSMKTHTDVLDGDISERRGITFTSLEDDDLAEQTLNQLSDGHSRRNSVRIDDNVGNNSLGGEGHVFLAIGHTDGTLLTVPRGELVTNLWNTDVANPYLGETVSLLGSTDENVVDDAVLVGLHRCTAVPLGVPRWHARRSVQWSCLADEDIVAGNAGAGLDEAIVVELAIFAMLHTTAAIKGRLLEGLRRKGTDGTHTARLLLIDVAAIVG